MPIEIRNVDCLTGLRQMAAAGEKANCVVTSPPYWGLRDYGIEPIEWPSGWIGVWGLEPTYQQYIANTLAVFDLLKPVLRDDGVIWWNLGDCYATEAGKSLNPGGRARGGSEGKHGYVNGYPVSQPNRMPQTVPAGSKLLLPHRVAIALMDAGWCVRQDNVWAKRSPMPESVSGWRWVRCKVKVDREPAPSGGLTAWDMGEHSHGPPGSYREQDKTVPVYEQCAGCEKCEQTGGFVRRLGKWRHTTAHEYVFQITKGGVYFADGDGAAERALSTRQRNPRSVWSLSTESYRGAHFATFPSEIPRRCIRASTSPAGCCPHCGMQWAPVVETVRTATRPGVNSKVTKRLVAAGSREQPCEDNEADVVGNRDPQRHVTSNHIVGYRPMCDCPEHDPIQATVLDICSGSGTTGAVCRELGRSYIGFEINPEYIELSRSRIAAVHPRLFQ